MQTNNILILVNNIFTNNKKNNQIKKNNNKNYKYFISTQPIKFNEIQIQLSLDNIILIKKSYVGRIFFVIFHNINLTI